MNASYNAVIVGQTGVGKSSLINYLYGQKVAKTGHGKPITNGFIPYHFELNGLPICLLDSWGLEVGKHEKWLQDLDKEFKQRGVNESADKWFHSAFYCIQAGGARIQECDIAIIKKFRAEHYPITVVLTKCDQVSEEIEEDLRKELQNQINGLSVISISTGGKSRAGVTTEPFGKEDIERQAFNDFFDSLILRLPLRCKSIMEQALEDWERDSKINAKENAGFMGFGQSDMEYGIKQSAKKLQQKIQELMKNEIKQTFKMYGGFATLLGYPPPNSNNEKINEGYFNNNNEVSTDEWWITPAVIILSPILLVWQIYSGKDNAIEKIEEYIYECKKEFQIIINKQVKEITEMLESLKLKVTEQDRLG